jgi:2'-5' RNA ligase
MRLFTAIDLPPQVRTNLGRLVDLLRPTAKVAWSPVNNLHITTKFIGEWPESDLEKLKDALAALPNPGAIEINIRDVGWFPNARRPRVFWAGVADGAALDELARTTEQAVAALGVPPENRPFAPHLTLARIREPIPLQNLFRAIDSLDTTEFGNFRADSFHLYLSAGGRYTRLADYPL